MSKSNLESISEPKIKVRTVQPLPGLNNLLQSYAQNISLTPFEFIEEKLASQDVTEELGSMFLRLYRHKVFLGTLKDLFNEYLISSKLINKEQAMDNKELIIIFYLVIFELTPVNCNNIYMNIEKKFGALHWVIGFLSNEESQLKIVEEGCKIYDKDFLLDNVIGKILHNESLMQQMSINSSEDVKKRRNAETRPLTIPKGPRMMSNNKKRVSLQQNQPEIINKPTFISKPVPKTTYESDTHAEKLKQAKMQNRKEAYELLAQAKKLKFKYAEPKASPKPPTPVVYKPILAKPPPKFDPVDVKPTTASLMRQAAFLAKEKEAEIREIDNLMAGAISEVSNSAFLEELRLAKEEESLQDIERKHLQGLLTREDAILAKQRHFQQIQAKKQQYQEDRIKLLETIDRYKRQEEEKTKSLVEKVQAIENAAKDAEAKLLKERRCNAKLIDYETQILLKQANEEREEELNKKMQLIKELKLLQQINARNNKVEFDPTETSNLGLLCEMSIAELQERLALLKVTMKEELEERKARIQAEKKKQQVMLEQMKEFVESAKGQKCKPTDLVKTKKTVAKRQVPEDIRILREKLKLARERRVSGSLTAIL